MEIEYRTKPVEGKVGMEIVAFHYFERDGKPMECVVAIHDDNAAGGITAEHRSILREAIETKLATL